MPDYSGPTAMRAVRDPHTNPKRIPFRLRTYRSRRFLLWMALLQLLMYLFYRTRMRRRMSRHVPLRLPDPRPLVTFSGGGFLMAYYFGVAIYLRDHFCLDNVRFAGISGGASAVISLCLGIDLFQVLLMGLHMHRWLREQGGPYLLNFQQCVDYAIGLFGQIGLSDRDTAAVSAQRRAFIGVTQCIPFQHRCANVPETVRDLAELQNCSMCILPFFRSPGTFEGKYHVDGGLSTFWSVPEEDCLSRAVTVTCLPPYATRLWPQTFQEADVQPDTLDLRSIFVVTPFAEQKDQVRLGYGHAKRSHERFVSKGLRPLEHAPLTPWSEWEALFASVDEQDLPPLTSKPSTARVSNLESRHQQILRTYSQSDLQKVLAGSRLDRFRSHRRAHSEAQMSPSATETEGSIF